MSDIHPEEDMADVEVGEETAPTTTTETKTMEIGGNTYGKCVMMFDNVDISHIISHIGCRYIHHIYCIISLSSSTYISTTLSHTTTRQNTAIIVLSSHCQHRPSNCNRSRVQLGKPSVIVIVVYIFIYHNTYTYTIYVLSLFLTRSAPFISCQGNYGGYGGYAISISSISIALSSLVLLMDKFSEDMYDKFGKHMNGLNFVWSFIGACFLTFKEPFTNTGNGFFAAWAVVLGCALANDTDLKDCHSKVKSLSSIMGLMTSSLVVMLASIEPVRDKGTNPYDPNINNYDEALFAMCLSCVTFVVLGFMLMMNNRGTTMPTKLYFGMMAILTMCWIIMACLVTFRGPFKVTGNGYFGSWAGGATSAFATFAAKQDLAC